MTFQTPPNEAERLDALRRYDVLDTPPDPAFDRVTQLAARLFDVPIALVSLIDTNRQWFKSAYGICMDQSEREFSFCSHAVLADDVLIVPDTQHDPRFSDNPLVCGDPHMRFYAGAPLRTPDGFTLGTLCIIDTQPRTLSAAQLATLADLAAFVQDELELHVANRKAFAEMHKRMEIEAALRASEAQYRLLFESNPEPMWVFHRHTLRFLAVNNAAITQYGYTRAEFLAMTIQDIRPEAEQARLTELFDETHALPTFSEQATPAGIWQHRKKDGTAMWVEINPHPIVFHGDPAVLVLANDITERRRNEALVDGQKHILELISRGRPLPEVLTALTQVIESQASDMLCSILLLDDDGVTLRHGAAPSLPDSYTQAIDGVVIGPTSDSVGMAAYLRESVIVTDIASDPRWIDFRDLALSHGLRGCWSSPIVSTTGAVLGTFAMYSRRPYQPGPPDTQLIQTGLHMAAIAIERHRFEESLRLLESAVQQVNESIVITTADLDLPGPSILFANTGFTTMTGYAVDEVLGKTPRLLQGPKTDRAVLDRLRATLTRHEVFRGEVINYRKDGSEFCLEWHIAPIRNEHGIVTHFISIQHDITQRKHNDGLREQLLEQIQLERARLEAVLQQLPAGVVIADAPSGTVILSNKQVASIWGETGTSATNDVGDNDPRELFQPDGIAYAGPDSPLMRSINTGEVVTAEEIEVARHDNVRATVRVSSAPIYDRAGTIVAGVATFYDITHQKRAEVALRDSQAKLQMITSQMPSILWTCDLDLRVTSMMGGGMAEMNMVERDYVGRLLPEIFGRLDKGTEPIEAHQAALRGESGSYELLSRDLIFEVRVEPLHDAAGQVIGCIALAINITERKGQEAALHESNARLHAIVNSEPECVKITDPDGTLLEMNPAGLAMIEADSLEYVQGIPVVSLVHPDDRAAYQEMHTAATHGHHHSLQFRVIGLKGGLHWMETSAVPLHDHAGTITAVLSVSRDVTERKQAEQALTDTYIEMSTLSMQLRRSRDLLRTLFDGLNDGLVLLDHDGSILAINQALAGLFGSPPEHLISQRWAAMCDSAGANFPGELALQTLYDGRGRRRRDRFAASTGEHRILDMQTFPLIGVEQVVDQTILYVADVTERVQVEALAIQSERLAANGRLVATMAHEINTPLQSIRSCLYLAGKATDERRENYLTLAREEIDRIGGILRHLLDLHRPGTGTSVPVDLNRLIERVLLITGGTLSDHRIEVIRNFDPHLPSLQARPDQLTQVLLNLTLNALDAMPDGGILRFTTGRRDSSGVDESSELVFELEDTGCGMSAEIQQRIFEPFFTTKSQGSGIGLAVSQKIITQHRSTISVRSVPDAGSTFTIIFPLTPHQRQEGGPT